MLSSVFQAGKVRTDQSPMPDDLITPRILTPGSMVVFGGAPKVGKSDFLLSWLYHLAAGEPFLKFSSPRPLRILYLQFEIKYHYLRERLQQIKLPERVLEKGDRNLYLTPKLRLILNDKGSKKVIDMLKKLSADEDIDILAIDPIRNVFDGGPNSGGENDNDSMMFFLQQRVEEIRDAVNPDAGIILVHHTKKILKQHLQEEPFQAFSGASSLRSYYTTGIMMYRPDENFTDRRLVFELRDGPHVSSMNIDKQDGQWIQLDPRNPRLIQKDYGAKRDAERIRKNDVILQLIFDEAAKGRVYTANQFSNAFESKAGLGAKRTIQERLGVLATQGYVKFFRNAEDYGLAKLARNKFGYVCVENMVIPDPSSPGDNSNESTNELIAVKPTHYKCPHTGAKLPVENADVWVYQEEDLHESD